MKGVGIAELKAKLSEHLKAVRRGRTVTVLDHDTPIARIVPYQAEPAKFVGRRDVLVTFPCRRRWRSRRTAWRYCSTTGAGDDGLARHVAAPAHRAATKTGAL